MKPVNQTTFTPPDGDCLSACIASILELPLDKVPNYIAYDNWFEKFDDFVAEHGYRLFWYKISEKYNEILGFTAKDVYGILCGKSSSGDWDHCVVIKNGKVVHDPNPNSKGLLDHKDIMVFVKINPKSERIK